MKKILIIQLLFISFFQLNSFAKVSDPETLIKNGISFTAHENVVTAVELKGNKVLWLVKLPVDIRATVYNPQLEEDLQLDVIDQMIINHPEHLLVRFKSGMLFSIEISSGKWRVMPHLPRSQELLE